MSAEPDTNPERPPFEPGFPGGTDPGVSSQPFRIVELAEIRGLSEADWEALRALCPDATVFQSYGWLQAWWSAFGAGRQLMLLVAYRRTELVGAVPLFREHESRSRRGEIRFVGDEHADYACVLARGGDRGVVTELINHLLEQHGRTHAIRLNDVPETSVLAEVLRTRAQATPWSVRTFTTTPCPRLQLVGNVSGVEAILAKKSLKRHAAKLAKQGTVEVLHLTHARDIADHLQAFFEQHQRRWAVTDYPSLFHSGDNRRFYENLLNHAAPGAMVFTLIRVDGQCVAYHFGLCSRDDLIWYKPSFEITLSHLSPGEVLLRELIVFAAESGCSGLDFTRGGESFKTRFSSEVRRNHSYVLFGSRARAMRDAWPRRARAVAHRTLNPGSGPGRLVRRWISDGREARKVGRGLVRACAFAASQEAKRVAGWAVSRRSVSIFSSAADSPSSPGETATLAHEAELETFLDVDRFGPLLSEGAISLREAYFRLNRGDKAFVIDRDGLIQAVGWASERTPFPVTEIDAVLHLSGGTVVLYDFYVIESCRGRGLYVELLRGIRAAMPGSALVIFALDSNSPSIRGIRRAGFVLDAQVAHRRVLGHSRLESAQTSTGPRVWELNLACASESLVG